MEPAIGEYQVRIIDLSTSDTAKVDDESTRDEAADICGEQEQIIVTEYIESNMLENMAVQFLAEDAEDAKLQEYLTKNIIEAQSARKRKRKDKDPQSQEMPSTSAKAMGNTKKTRQEVEESDKKSKQKPKPIIVRNCDSLLLKEWRETLANGDKVLCPIPGCVMMYGSVPGIRTHYQSCTGTSKMQGSFRCNICQLDFNLEKMLKRHETLVHTKKTEVETIESLEDAVRFILPDEVEGPQPVQLTEEIAKRQPLYILSNDDNVEADGATSEQSIPKKRRKAAPKKVVAAVDESTAVVVAEQMDTLNEGGNSNYQIVGYVSNEDGGAQNLSLICDGNIVNVEVPQTANNGDPSDLIVVHWEVPVGLEELMNSVEAPDGTTQPENEQTNKNMAESTTAAINGRSHSRRGRGQGRGRGRSYRKGDRVGGGERKAAAADDEASLDDSEESKEPPKKIVRYSRRHGLRSSLPADLTEIDSAIVEQMAKIDSQVQEAAPPKRKSASKLKPPNPLDVVKCGVCLDEFDGEKKFQLHAMQYHNGLARPFGQDHEFNEAEKRQTLVNTLKKIGRLRCLLDRCNRKSFSTLPGYIYHERACGKQIEERKVECELCGKDLVPESLQCHMRTFHPPTPPPHELAETVLEELPLIEVKGKKKKRAAAKKALKTVHRVIREKLDEDWSPPRPSRGRDTDDSDGDFVLEMSEGDEEVEHPHSDGNSPDEDIPLERLYVKPKKIHLTKQMFLDWRSELARDGNVPCRNSGCDYISDTMKKVEIHYKICEHAQHGGLYTCVVCQFACASKTRMLNHVMAHKITIGRSPVNTAKSMEYLSRMNVPEELKKRRASKVPAHQRVFKAIRSGEFGNKFFTPHIKFALGFFRTHYARKPDVTFPDWLPSASNWTLVDSETERQRYFPVCSHSVYLKSVIPSMQSKKDSDADTYRSLERFEAMEHCRDSTVESFTCFLGGPVWALSWCPTPHENANCRQYFAAACSADAELTHTYKTNELKPGLIQIWDAGILESIDKSTLPKMVFGIAHNYGAVWSIIWCPSGCWEDPDSKGTTRLGVIAVAFGDGRVRIFSVPHPQSLSGWSEKELQQPTIYVGQPVAVLELSAIDLDSQVFQATSLSWLQSKGHGLIAAGYTNGYIGLFDLTTTSPLLRENLTGKPDRIKCYQAFQAHGSVITGLDFAHSQGGRHLVTVSRDRCLKFWDLRDTCLPYNIIKKSWFTCAAWMPHWCGACVSSDDALSLITSGNNYYECGYYGENSGTLLSHNSNVWDVSPSYWFNSIASCDGAGEVAICVMGQLMQLYASLKSANYKRLPLYRVEAEPKPDESSILKPRTYAEASRVYNLSIKDQPLWDFQKISLDEIKHVSSDTQMLEASVEEFPLTSINRIAWNQNLGSHLWIASGGQSGLVRLVRIGGLKSVVPVDNLRSKLLELKESPSGSNSPIS